METYYKCINKTDDWGEINGKKWKGSRIVVREETWNTNNECVQAQTKIFKALPTVALPPSTTPCNLLFDAHGRVSRVESISRK